MPNTKTQRAILVAAVLASTAAAGQSHNDYLVVSEAKEAVADTLPNPKGARFRRLFLAEYGDSKVTLCGEINGKNRMGSYMGYRRFLVEDTLDSLIDPEATPGDTPGRVMMQGIFDRTYKRVCAHKFKDVQ